MDANWSKDLQQQTLKVLDDLPALPDGMLRMKHKTEGHGHFALVDLLVDKFVLHRTRGDQVRFTDAQAVVAAGWAID